MHSIQTLIFFSDALVWNKEKCTKVTQYYNVVFEMYKSNVTLSIECNHLISVCLHIAKTHFTQCNTIINHGKLNNKKLFKVFEKLFSIPQNKDKKPRRNTKKQTFMEMNGMLTKFRPFGFIWNGFMGDWVHVCPFMSWPSLSFLSISPSFFLSLSSLMPVPHCLKTPKSCDETCSAISPLQAPALLNHFPPPSPVSSFPKGKEKERE